MRTILITLSVLSIGILTYFTLAPVREAIPESVGVPETKAILATSTEHVLPVIRGEYGKKCYLTGSHPATITRPMYFETFKECLASLRNERITSEF